jgi:Spy/CpxP family protein refolding chaperone
MSFSRNPGAAMEAKMVDDPTGTVGAVAENVFALAVKGGPRFMQRLQQLSDATDRHDQALAKLRLGQDVETALKDAEDKRSAAAAALTQAAKVLADAETKAKAQIAKADQIVASAKALQSETDKRVKQVETREQAATEANAKAERTQADANRLRDDLKSKTDYLRTRLREIANA